MKVTKWFLLLVVGNSVADEATVIHDSLKAALFNRQPVDSTAAQATGQPSGVDFFQTCVCEKLHELENRYSLTLQYIPPTMFAPEQFFIAAAFVAIIWRCSKGFYRMSSITRISEFLEIVAVN